MGKWIGNLNILTFGSGNAGDGGDASSENAYGGSACRNGRGQGGGNGGSAYTGKYHKFTTLSLLSQGFTTSSKLTMFVGKGGEANGGSIRKVNNG